MKHNIQPLIAVLTYYSIALLLTACGSSKKMTNNYKYFNTGNDTISVVTKETTIHANDLLSIQVFSRSLNQEQTAIFNLPASNGIPQGYPVSQAGFVEMPVIGNIQAVGLTKEQLQKLLAQKLTDYVKNPSVLVRLLEFNVNVLGEVKSPGTKKFAGDRVNLIDALGAAGDLTDFGTRDDVTVIREESGKKVYHSIDLTDKNLFNSPAFALQPNDVVYVAPNNTKIKTLSVDPEKQRKTGVLLTISSLILSIGTIIITSLK